MPRWMLVALVIALGALRPDASAGQTMLVQLPVACGEPTCPERRLAVSLDPLGVTGERLVAPGSLPTYVTPDGRFGVALRYGNGAPSVFVVSDFVTGGSFDVAVPGVAAFIGNPARTELYTADASGVMAVSTGGLRRLVNFACGTAGATPEAISADGTRVAFRCGWPGPVNVFDTTSGALVGTVAALSALSADGSHGYVVDGFPVMLRRIEVATGTEVAQVALTPAAGSGTVVVDPRTGNVLLQEGEFFGARLFDPALQFLRTAVSAGQGRWTFDPSRARAYTASGRWFEGGFGGAPTYSFTVGTIDTEQWVSAGSATAANFTCCVGVGYAFPPAAPTSLAATVTGNAVSLSWTASVPAASVVRYVLEAGSASGVANIATFDLGLQTSLAVGGVPPGTYYVRVRAMNYAGASLPSNEVVVFVP